MNAAVDYKPVALAGFLLAFAALLGTGVLSLVSSHSEPYIADNKHKALLENLQAVIPPSRFDNDIANDTLVIEAEKSEESPGAVRVFRARSAGAPVAVAYEWTAHDGYNGDIVLLMGVSVDGKITGVRVIEHRETPGLGDAIEARRSNWIEAFLGKSLLDPNRHGWRVKKDGGDFDQFTGATITPRAVVKAVHEGLLYFQRHREEVFAVSALSDPAKAQR